ncbi:MAG: phosphopantothenoylcysteine decarboxylase, partial [Oscillospiraceae bacterium]|nr:phosphopantothenoylcysteine decarboxylase [Oscillospiraceae bacterium]
MLRGKTIVLGVTGGIACYKAAALASALVKLHADVQVIMTANATQFIAPLTFEQLTGNRALVDTFDRNFEHKVEHVAVADRADM